MSESENTPSSAKLDIAQFVDLLAVDGTLVLLGAPSENISLPAMPLIAGRRSIAGSANGGIPITQEMLDFCAEHDVLPETELITADYINEAYERVLSSDLRYRFVIDAKSFA